ncbi:MAG TPA: hypothetical protein VF529_18810 [Solirubrobacteraceae bacterium]|jgi:hypothetical protein
MATTHSAPIDLYEESREGFAEEEQDTTTPPASNERRRPDFNGDRDDGATEQSHRALERVLGW